MCGHAAWRADSTAWVYVVAHVRVLACVRVHVHTTVQLNLGAPSQRALVIATVFPSLFPRQTETTPHVRQESRHDVTVTMTQAGALRLHNSLPLALPPPTRDLFIICRRLWLLHSSEHRSVDGCGGSGSTTHPPYTLPPPASTIITVAAHTASIMAHTA